MLETTIGKLWRKRSLEKSIKLEPTEAESFVEPDGCLPELVEE